ncbi:MAG: DsbA family protein [Lachnospiraceae bacterium]|nr:DsbA family protein [Robinsoniella sp.]MDY3766830.1 DsbA family protein [Lachnospiraceae bacterium]
MEKPLKIRFVSDYVCPYCLVAKIPLLEAIKGRNVEVEWVPYELTEEPAQRIDTYHDPVRKEKWGKTLVPICKELGIEMKLPPKVIPRPYTRLAFEGFYYAKEQQKGDVYNDLMYRAYFIEELDIGDIDVLVSLADRVGLDAEDFRDALEKGIYTQRQKDAVSYAKKELQIHTVPTIFIGDKKVEGGIYRKEEFVVLIDEALKENFETVHGFSCDEHGCG